MPRSTTIPPPSEAAIQKTALQWLNAQPECRATRRNVGAVVAEYRGKRRFIKFAEPGQSDITGWIVVDGRAVHLEAEAKAPGRRPSAVQLAWLRAVNDAGGIGFWFDSLTVLEKVYRHVAAGGRVVFLPNGDYDLE